MDVHAKWVQHGCESKLKPKQIHLVSQKNIHAVMHYLSSAGAQERNFKHKLEW